MDLTRQDNRRQVITYIESNENKGRKAKSYKASEIYHDNIKPFVINDLRAQFSEQTIREMPVSSNANIAKRIVNQLATVYQEAPQREWPELSEQQQVVAYDLYHSTNVNKKLNIANKYLKLHKQALLWMIPKNGELTLRVLQPHQWDVVVDENDPEQAIAYVISAYDNYDQLQEDGNEPGTATGYRAISEQNIQNYKQSLPFKEREKLEKKRYLWWTKESNYITNGLGEIVGEELPNPIGALPFIEIFEHKEFEYWVRGAGAYTNFTIAFNSMKSMIGQVVKMQGFSQAVIKGPRDLLMESYQIGPTFILKLIDDINAGVSSSFEYVNPGSNIDGCLKYLESELSLFLTSEGIDPKSVTMDAQGNVYSSGIERLLSLIEKMQASRSDYDLFQYAETKLWNLIKLWSVALASSSDLRQGLKLGSFNADVEILVQYARPEMVTTDADKLVLSQQRIDLGVSSVIDEIAFLNDMSREQAEEKFAQIQIDQGFEIEARSIPTEDIARD